MMRSRLSWRRLIRMRDQLLADVHEERRTEVVEEMLGRSLRITEELRSAGRCQRCGRKLENPDSVKRGIGPECLKVAAA